MHTGTSDISATPLLARADTRTGLWKQPAVVYPYLYIAFLFMSAMDIIVTWHVLYYDGEELNPVANLVLMWGFAPDWIFELERAVVPLTLYKFALVLLVVIICEEVGRNRYRTGRSLAIFAVGITSIPVALGIIQLLAWVGLNELLMIM